MKILIITQWFEPEPALKGLEFAGSLQKNGHSVSVITGFPNYPKGKLYPGYRVKFLQKETIDGIEVSRVPLYPSHNSSAIKRTLNYCSFAASSLIYGVFFGRKVDVIYAYHPPLTVSISAVIIGFFRRTPVVVDIQDLWPDTLKATNMVNSAKVLRLVELACRFVYRRASHITLNSTGFKGRLKERGVPESKMTTIYNWCSESIIGNPTKPDIDFSAFEGKFNIVFAGNMGRAQALQSVIGAAKIVSSTNQNIQFIFIGNGLEVENLKSYVHENELENVIFYASVPHAEIGYVLAKADALLVHLRKDELFEITIPSKTQSYLFCGKPVLMGVEGESADMILSSGAGVVVEPENPQSISEGVLQLANLSADELLAMEEKAQEYYMKHFSLEQGVDAFLEIFHEVVEQK